jgi:hypothetical protein
VAGSVFPVILTPDRFSRYFNGRSNCHLCFAADLCGAERPPGWDRLGRSAFPGYFNPDQAGLLVRLRSGVDRIANAYRLVKIDPYRHMGTAGRSDVSPGPAKVDLENVVGLDGGD